jgi:hypothetical protein
MYDGGRRHFDAEDTVRTMGSLIPKGVHWVKAAVAAFEPEKKCGLFWMDAGW